jgi:hypothetical protein
LLVEPGESRKEPHYLRFREDVWEDAEIKAELRELVEVKQRGLRLRIEVVVGYQGLVNTAENFNHVLILEHFHQLTYLVVAVSSISQGNHIFDWGNE